MVGVALSLASSFFLASASEQWRSSTSCLSWQIFRKMSPLKAGFHGTPYRWTVGRAVSHGCVRLYEENVQEVFDLVRVGTQVTVLP